MSRARSQLQRLVGRTCQRLLVADLVRLGGLWLTVSAATALALTLGDRFMALGLPIWLIALVAVSGLPIAGALAWSRRSAGLDAAVILDEGLGLKDRLGTAIALEAMDSIDHDDPMRGLVQADAERLAARIDPRAAARIDWPLSWGSALLGAVGCVMLLWLVEPRDVFARPGQAAEQAALADARERAAESLRQRAEQLRQADELNTEATQPAHSEAKQRALDTLERLARQFDAPPTGDGSAESTSAGSRQRDAELSSAAREAMELADRLDREEQIQREAQERAAKRLADLAPAGEPGAANEFAKSLETRDMEAATKWLESLEERLNSASNEERQAVADSLRETAERVADAAREEPSPQPQAGPDTDLPLEDLGLTREQIDQWLEDPPSLDELRRALQEQGHDPLDAQELAEQVQRELADRAADEQAQRQLEETAKRLSDLADSIDQPPPQPREPSESATENPSEPPTDDEQASPVPDVQPADPPSSGTEPTAENPSESGSETSRPTGKETESQSPTDPAQQGEKPGATGTPTPGETGQSTSPPEPAPGETGKPGEGQRPDAPTKPAEEPSKSPNESPTGTEPPKAEPGAPRDESGAVKPNPQGPGESLQPDEQGSREPGEAGSPQPEPGGEKPQPGERGPQEPGSPTASPPDEGATPDSATPPTIGQEGEAPPEDGASPSVAENARRVREALDQLDRSGRVPPNQEISQEMRDAAKELLDQMSPEERQELEQWAAERARENADGQGDGSNGSRRSLLDRTLPTQAVQNPKLFEYDTEDLDLQGEKGAPNDRVIAEMDGSDQDRPEGAVDRQPMNTELVREAAQAIEQALNEEAIPPRYRPLIRNWARRFPNRETPPAESSEP